MTHLGFVAILIGLLPCWWRMPAPETSSPCVAASAALAIARHGWSWRALALLGFGSKAGIVPLHVWLPRAHPEAPSHVSALMSGGHGQARACTASCGSGSTCSAAGPRGGGLLVLALGAVLSALRDPAGGVGTDLKRLLAYSTTENMGWS